MTRRTERLNSLLKEVISEVIFKEVKNPSVSTLVTVTEVDISKDLHHAKVMVSVIGSEQERKETVEGLNQAAGFIATKASKQVVMRFFPALRFILDDSVEKHMRIDTILREIEDQKQNLT